MTICLDRKYASRRRHLALEKIKRSAFLDDDTKRAVEAIFSKLHHQSNYTVAWPSAKAIAGEKTERTGHNYIAIVRVLGIFHVTAENDRNHSPDKLREELAAFGITPKLERSDKRRAPNLYRANLEHPLWDVRQKNLPATVAQSMAESVRRLKECGYSLKKLACERVTHETENPLATASNTLDPCNAFHGSPMKPVSYKKETSFSAEASAPSTTEVPSSADSFEDASSKELASANSQPDLSDCERTPHPPTDLGRVQAAGSSEEGEDLEKRGVAVCDREGLLTQPLSVNDFSGPRDEAPEQSGVKLPESALLVIAGRRRKAEPVPVDPDHRPRNPAPVLALPVPVAGKSRWDSAGILERMRRQAK